MFHTVSWLLWLVAAVLAAFAIHNPLYLLLTLGASWLVYMALGRRSPMGSSWGAFVKVGLFFFAIAVPFNALSIHLGRIVLFRLPAHWPIVGGPITLEALIAGAGNGLALLAILAVFAAFNAAVDHYQLLRATPPFLFQAGVIVSIAITFVPQMVLSAAEIREAQRIRGHRFRSIRDLRPLVLPLLASSLERAIQLAETMEARGFGAAARPASRRWALLSQVAAVLALLALLAGMVLIASGSGAAGRGTGSLGRLLALLGGGGLALVLLLQGRRVQRTRYRRPAWQARDTAVAAASALAAAALVAAKLAIPEALVYSPYPPNSLLPSFHPLVGAALLLLAAPALLVPRGREGMAGSAEAEQQP